MRATLTKSINVKTATAYLVFEKEQERSDIQEFLKGNEFENEMINCRVKEYLNKLHLLNNDGSLSKRGELMIQTGKISMQEEGKYKIWFTESDNFLGSRILFFKRIEPKKDTKEINELNIDFEKESYFLPIGEEKLNLIKLFDVFRF